MDKKLKLSVIEEKAYLDTAEEEDAE